MLHELKTIVSASRKAHEQGIGTVLASVVALEGSSYRRPGVRMLILENGTTVGAVSGGCVEKEIVRQARGVFSEGEPRLMVYDGRFRLGCDGILYILVEPFAPNENFYSSFQNVLKKREGLKIESHFSKEEAFRNSGGSVFEFDTKNRYTANNNFDPEQAAANGLTIFTQELPPRFRLVIVGAEHDAVALCKAASLLGWEVLVVAPPDESKTANYFPGVEVFLPISEADFERMDLDDQTAVMVMMHGLVNDLKYLSALRNKKPAYLGLLGPSRRREKILSETLEHYPDTPIDFLESIHGPAGINIGAETPQEIAVSILSEILSVLRKQQPISLKDKKRGIHQ